MVGPPAPAGHDVNGDGLADIADRRARLDARDTCWQRLRVRHRRRTATTHDRHRKPRLERLPPDGAAAGDHAGNSVTSVRDLNGEGRATARGRAKRENNSRLNSGSVVSLWGKGSAGGIDWLARH